MSGMHSLLLLCLLYHTVSGWHAYDEHKYRVMKAERCTPIWISPEANATEIDTCPCYHEATRPYSSDFIERLSLWPDLMGQVDVEHGEALYGSQWALEAIHASQNPPDCRKAKYLISGGWPYGFGELLCSFPPGSGYWGDGGDGRPCGQGCGHEGMGRFVGLATSILIALHRARLSLLPLLLAALFSHHPATLPLSSSCR